MEKITITLTLNELHHLNELVGESADTGNEEWDDVMQNILEKIKSKI